MGGKWRGTNYADSFRSPFNDRLIASGSDDGKVFIWQVPQGFTLHTDAEEPSDVAPLSKLTGHSRYVTLKQLGSPNISQEGRTSPLQSCSRKHPRIGVWRLHYQALGCWNRSSAFDIEAWRHCTELVMECERIDVGYHLSR